MKQLLILLLAIIATNTYSQSKTLDSLLLALKTAKQDTAKLTTMYALCGVYNDANNYEAEKRYAYDGLAMSERIGYKEGMANGYIEIGNYFLNISNYSKALENFLKAKGVFEQLGDKKNMASALFTCGRSCWASYNYPNALHYYQESLKISEQLGDKPSIGYTYTFIGIIYSEIFDYEDAISYLQKALKIDDEIGDKSRKAYVLLNLGLAYMNMDMPDFAKALEYTKGSLAMSEEINNKSRIVAALSNMGYIYSKQAQYTKALENFAKGLKASYEINDQGWIAFNLVCMGEVYEKQGNIKEALAYETKGLPIALQTNELFSIKTAYGTLAAIDYAKKKYKDAYEHYRLFRQYQDSLSNKEKNNKVTQLSMQFQFDKKQDSIKVIQEKKDELNSIEMKNQKNMVLASLALVLLLLLAVGASMRAYRQKKNDHLLIAHEKQKSDNLLLNILPAEIADELKEKGKSEAQLYEEVSVLFTDFVNFTGISETLLPQELVAELHECFTAFDGIIEKNGLEKIKTIGDAYLAVCGLPQTDPLHAQKTVQAALDIRDFIEYKKSDGGLFNIKIGICSGPLVAGIVGVKKFAYDVWGDTVNTAARMEQNGEAGKVNIAGATYQLIKDHFKTTYRGRLPAKNKGEIDMYFVEGVK